MTDIDLQFPFAAVAGDCPAHRAVSVVVQRGGRRAIGMGELCDAVGCETAEEKAEVYEQMRKFAEFGIVRTPKPNTVLLSNVGPIGEELSQLEWAIVAEATDHRCIADVELESWYE